jgi:hypothetical protein
MLPKDLQAVSAPGATIMNPAGPPSLKSPGVSGILTTIPRTTIKETPQDLMILPIRKETATWKVQGGMNPCPLLNINLPGVTETMEAGAAGVER